MTAQTPKMSMSRPVAAALAVLLVAGTGFVAHDRLSTPRTLPDGLIQANGRIEGDHVAIASKLPGRIAELPAREGDEVTVGQVLAVLDGRQVEARVAQAQAAVQVVEQQHQAAQTALAALRRQVPLEIASADTGIGQADAVVRKARAAQEQAERDAVRLETLAARGSVPVQRAELARLAAEAAAADVQAAEQARLRAQKLAAEARLGHDRVRAKADEIDALAAGLAQARATLAEAESVRADLTLKAPSAGVVVTRVRQAGEVIAAGSPILDLVDLAHLYLKVYVPEQQVGRLRLGLPAQVFIDAQPDRPFAARVAYISPRAEFTPKEVQTADERVKLTYAVKLQLDADPQHRLAPGLPADAVIRWKESVPWQRPVW